MFKPISPNLTVAAGVVAVGISTAVLVAAAQRGQVEREGSVSDVRGTCPALVFSVGDTTISTNAATEFEEGSCAEIAPGVRVDVDGALTSAGELAASEIEVESADDDDDDDDESR